MALRGAVHAIATRVAQAGYWPVATRGADGTLKLGITSETPHLAPLPEPVTTLDWDTGAAIDERLMEEACKIAYGHRIGIVEIKLEAAEIAGAIVTSIEARENNGGGICLTSIAAGLYASTRRTELTSSTLEEQILVAWPLATAIGELIRETCALDRRWEHDQWVRWHARVITKADGKHKVEIQRYRLEPMKEGTVRGRQAQVIEQMRMQDASPVTW